MDSEKLLIPGAIIIAGALIGGGIYLSGGTLGLAQQDEGGAVLAGQAEGAPDSGANPLAPSADNVRPVDETDHLYGDPNAPITIIEYSDFECPFCARFHPTLERIIEEYDGEVNWVYRHFPLTSIHSRAYRASVASECIAELAGPEAFWSAAQVFLENIRSLGDDFYVAQAAEYGIPETPFRECLDSDRHDAGIDADLQNGVDSGARGTPFNVIVDKEGNTFPFSGALPYPQTKAIVDRAVNNAS